MTENPNAKWEADHPDEAKERKLGAAIRGMYGSVKLCRQIGMPPEIVLRVVEQHFRREAEGGNSQ